MYFDLILSPSPTAVSKIGTEQEQHLHFMQMLLHCSQQPRHGTALEERCGVVEFYLAVRGKELGHLQVPGWNSRLL